MKFSVLISVYYKEKPAYLKKALDSVVNQTLKPTEIVLVEDGALTNELYEIIDNFKKENLNLVKSVKLDKNQGLGKALQIGLLQCSYDYVARMDTDDISLPNRFEIQTQFLTENPKVDIVGSWLKEFDAKTEEIYGARILPKEHNDIVKFMKKRNGISHPTTMYKKEVILKAGNYQHYFLYEDYYLWVRCIQNGAVLANIKEYLLLFRSGEEMIKRRGGIKYLQTELKFQKWLYDIKFISVTNFIVNTSKRMIIRLLGKHFRYYMYKKILRTKINE